MDFIGLDDILKENMPRKAKGMIILYWFREAESEADHEKIFELANKHRLMDEVRIMHWSLMKLAEAFEVNHSSYLGEPDPNKRPPSEGNGQLLY